MNDIKICVFDAYGTLFDFNSAVEKSKSKLGDNYINLTKLWREKQLEYSFLREIMNDYTDFYNVTKDALEYAMNYFNIYDENLFDELIESYNTLKPYPEVLEFLEILKNKNVKKVILSNGSSKMLNAAVNSSKINFYIDEAISVDTIKKFKPNHNVYNLVSTKYNIPNENVLFFSSNGWDIAGASKFGFNTVWINRLNKPVEKLSSKPTLIVSNLTETLNKF